MEKQSEVNITVNIEVSPEVLSAFKTVSEFLQAPGKFIKFTIDTGEVVPSETNCKATTTLDDLSRSN